MTLVSAIEDTEEAQDGCRTDGVENECSRMYMEDIEMKQVTLAELVEMARNDKALERKILEASKKFGGAYSDALKTLASELGFDLILEEKIDGLEEVSDDALDQVAGGIKFFGDAFCVFMIDLFGFDGKNYCD